MDQDVPQWLTEIQSLQQRLSEVSQERSAAYEQLARWQGAYQTEAQQRRKDLRRLQTVIYRLDQENKRLKQQLHLPPDARSPFFMSNDPHHVSDNSGLEHASPPTSGSNLEQSGQNEREQSSPPSSESPLLSQSPNRYTTDLQEKLQDVLAECDRLSKALSQEQADHEQTRQTLMTALGDTVEQLERERQRHTQAQQGLPSANTSALVPQQIEPNSLLPEQQQKRLTPAPPPSPTRDAPT